MINLKTSRISASTCRQSILARADEVIV